MYFLHRQALVLAFFCSWLQVVPMVSAIPRVHINKDPVKRQTQSPQPNLPDCPQDRGEQPLMCSEKNRECSAIGLERGMCQMPDRSLGSGGGFIYCGCCESEVPECRACGGDAGGGVCGGLRFGSTAIRFKGCKCDPRTRDGEPDRSPCPQDHGKPPPTCDEKNRDCSSGGGLARGLCSAPVSPLGSGLAFALCGCCESEKPACRACGGDAGGGVCLGGPYGIGERTAVRYKGCECTPDGEDVPPDYSVCPQDKGQRPPMCNDTAGACYDHAGLPTGLCLAEDQSPGSNGTLVYCGCCESEKPACQACGGDAGGGVCLGAAVWKTNARYQGCECNPNGTGGLPPLIPPIIPPPAFPIPPPGTPSPKRRCGNEFFAKCSECEGKDGWCQSGPDAGCMCRNDCSAEGAEQPPVDEQPSCEEDTCEGQDGKCTVGPSQNCDCKAEKKCPKDEDTPMCSDDSCGGATDDKIVSKCSGGGENKDENKDCRCYSPSEPVHGYPFDPVRLREAEAVLDSLADLTDPPGVCEAGFSNSTVFSSNSTGNVRDMNFYFDTFPEVSKNPGALWRLTDTSGYVGSWRVLTLPDNKVIQSSESGSVTFSILDTNGVTGVNAQGYLDPPGNGDCPIEVPVSVEAACSFELPKPPETPTRRTEPSCLPLPSRPGEPSQPGEPSEPGRPPLTRALCNANTASSVIEFVKLGTDPAGSECAPTLPLADVFDKLVATLCADKCEIPSDIPSEAGVSTLAGGCEIAVGIANDNEIFVWRERVAATKAHQRDCVESFSDIMDTCGIDKGRPQTGEAEGLYHGNFFAAGVRKRDAPTKKHESVLTNGLVAAQIMCDEASCGVDSAALGGTCKTGEYEGLHCCGREMLSCTDERCNAAGGGLCTGELNGCVCYGPP